MKIRGPDYQNPSNQTRITYLAYGRTDNVGDSGFVLRGDGSQSIVTEMPLGLRITEMNSDGTESPGQEYLAPNQSQTQFTVGEWHQVELWMTINDIDPTEANGEIKWWLDGELLAHYTGLRLRSDINPKAFYHLRVSPEHSGDQRTRNDHWLIDHVYVSADTSSAGSSWTFRENEPSGYSPLTEDDHSSETGEWNYRDRSGTYEIANPTDEPDVQAHGADGTYRTHFPAGMTDGHDAANASDVLPDDSIVAFYWAYTVKLSSNWENNTNLTKHALWFWGQQIGGHLDFITDGNSGSDPMYLGFTLKSPNVFPRIAPDDTAAAYVSRGEWHQIEFQVVADTLNADKDFRVWLDGQLVLEKLNVTYLDEGPHLGDFTSEVKYANTYGGGGQDVPHDQYMDVGHSYVSGQ